MNDKKQISIADAVRRLSKKPKNQTVSAKVLNVDVDKNTASCLIEVYDLELDVDLTAFEMQDNQTSVVIVPKKNSYVLLQRKEGTDDFIIIKYNEVESIYLGGKKYGTIKAEELQVQINKLKASVELIKSAIQGAAVALGDGGAVFKSNIIAALRAMDTGDFTKIINDKVKHGN